MAVNVGTAIAYLDLDTTKFTSGIGKANEKLKILTDDSASFNQKMSGLSSGLKSAGSQLTAGLTLPIAGAGAAMVKTAADFEAGLSKVEAISGASGDDMVALRDKAMEMGAKTKFSATEASEAFQYMAMAGWEAEAMMDGIDGIMNLAAADGLDLATTSDIVTDALTAFGLKAEDSAHFADVLAQASSSANTNVSMLGESFKYVAPVAGALGYSAEDTAVALGLMANAGIKGSQAGTSLRSALTNLASPTDSMKGVMLGYGVSLEDVNGNMLSLGDLMTDLRSKMGRQTDESIRNRIELEYQNAAIQGSVALTAEEIKALGEASEESKKYATYVAVGSNAVEEMSDEQLEYLYTLAGLEDQLGETLDAEDSMYLAYVAGAQALGDMGAAQQASAVSTLFGKEAMAGMLNIINASEDDYKKLTESINDCDGRAEEMANTMGDNLEGKIVLFQSAMETLSIKIAENIIPALTDLVEWFTGIVTWLGSLDEDTYKWIVTIGGVVAAVGPVLVILGQMIDGFLKVKGAISLVIKAISGGGGVMSVLTALTGPIGIIIAAVAALAFAWATDFGGIRDKTREILNSIKQVITNSLSLIKKIWDENWLGIKDLFFEIIEMIRIAFSGFLEMLSSLFSAFSALLRGDWEELWNSLKRFISAFISTVLSLFGEFLKAIVTLLINIAGSLYAAGVAAFEKVKQGFSEVWDKIKSWFEMAKEDPIKAIKSIFSSIKQAGKDLINNLWDGIKDVWNSLTSWVEDSISWLMDKLKFWKDTGDDIKREARRVKDYDDFEEGSHRSGLDYVPYDGYKATLHTGERVLTQEENRQYSNGAVSGGNQFNFYGTPPLDEKETARQFELSQRKLALGF